MRRLAASEPSGCRIEHHRRVSFVLQNLTWLIVLCSVSKVFNTCCRGRSPGRSLSPRAAGLTLPSSGRLPAGFARLQPQLMSNVRPPRRLMLHRYASARLPFTEGVVAEVASGCPFVGGQRTNRLSHRTLPQRLARASESRMAQRSVRRLKGLQRSALWSLACAFTVASHRRPNPSVKRTPNSGPRPAVSGAAVPLLVAAYLQR